ncbi:MAG: hypothetical protein WBE86_00755 [Candidatus Acidiferrales bacterium]
MKRRGRQSHSIPISRLPDRSYAARDRGFHVLAAMRHDSKLSLTHAAKLEGVKPETLKKYFPSALEKTKGKFRATKSDRYTTTLYVPDASGGSVAIKTRSSKDREALGQYLRDLGRYLRGDRDALSRWHGKKIAGIELVTDEGSIIAMEPALSDFALYRSFNGGMA